MGGWGKGVTVWDPLSGARKRELQQFSFLAGLMKGFPTSCKTRKAKVLFDLDFGICERKLICASFPPSHSDARIKRTVLVLMILMKFSGGVPCTIAAGRKEDECGGGRLAGKCAVIGRHCTGGLLISLRNDLLGFDTSLARGVRSDMGIALRDGRGGKLQIFHAQHNCLGIMVVFCPCGRYYVVTRSLWPLICLYLTQRSPNTQYIRGFVNI